jgi:metal-dependent amidase/aminoacylase/carboxypeptidase family protein
MGGCVTTKDRARQAFEQHEGDLQDLSQWMYDHPEVAFEEYETSRKAVELLRGAGLEVEYPAYGLDTAFAARIGSSGPVPVSPLLRWSTSSGSG